mgnify:CR=1 FL=1
MILLSTIVLWFLQGYGFTDGVFGPVEDNNSSLLAAIGNAVMAPKSAPTKAQISSPFSLTSPAKW